MSNSEEKLLKDLLDAGKLDEAIALGAPSLATPSRTPLVWELIKIAQRRKDLVQKFQGAGAGSRQISCPKCQLKLRVVSPSSMSVSCYGCGTLTDLQTLKSVGVSGTFKETKSVIKIGLEGTLDGQQVQIIGRASYFANIREWDSEDKDYERGSWRWVEWSLLTEGGEIWYLCVDSEGYSISKSFTPKNPTIPESHTDKVDFSKDGSWLGSGNRIQEWGEAQTTAAEGEFSWVPDKKDIIRYAEYPERGSLVGVEWRTGSGRGRTVEAEFYRATPIDYGQLLRAFDLKDLLLEWDREMSYRRQRTRWALPFLIIGGLFLLTGLGSGGSGKQIFSDRIDSISTIPDEGTILGPVALKKSGSVHSLKFSVSIPDNSDMWVGVELLDDQQDAINASDGELWRESGYDDGEHYSESDIAKDMFFFLQQPGTYYLRVYGEPDQTKPVDGSVSVEVREGAMAPLPFTVSGLGMLLVGLLVSPLFRGRPARRI